MKLKLKQPTKYINLGEAQQIKATDPLKTKPISKQDKQKIPYQNKKTIKKKHQASSLRLEKINDTFQNIYANADSLLEDFQLDKDKLSNLLELKQKAKCKCQRNVKYFCLKCMTKITTLPFPEVQLPLTIQVIHHESEKINKSSALPLSFLTKQINFHFYSSTQESKNQKVWQQLPKANNSTYILFPHKKSKSINQVNVQEIKNLIILDCTWFQTDLLIEELQNKGHTNFISLEPHKSMYWRYNHHNQSALSSVEAIAYFMRQRQNKKSNTKNDDKLQIEKMQKQQQLKFQQKKYDNLLFLYALNLMIIQRDQINRMAKTAHT